MIKCQSDSKNVSASSPSGPFLTHFDMSATLMKQMTKNVFHLSFLSYSMLLSLLDCSWQKWTKESGGNRLNEKKERKKKPCIFEKINDISLMSFINRYKIGIFLYHACKDHDNEHAMIFALKLNYKHP